MHTSFRGVKRATWGESWGNLKYHFYGCWSLSTFSLKQWLCLFGKQNLDVAVYTQTNWNWRWDKEKPLCAKLQEVCDVQLQTVHGLLADVILQSAGGVQQPQSWPMALQNRMSETPQARDFLSRSATAQSSASSQPRGTHYRSGTWNSLLLTTEHHRPPFL